MIVYFNTINEFKREEFQAVAEAEDFTEFRLLDAEVTEINSVDLEQVVRNKTLEAFEARRVPLLVEHGSLKIDALGGLPGPLSKPFWDTLHGSIVDLVGEGAPATAESGVGYCDGRRVLVFTGSVRGRLVASRGDREFQWDPIFLPEGETRTLAEMDATERTRVSHFSKAMRKAFAAIGS